LSIVFEVNLNIFINNNLYLIATFFIGITWRHLNQTLLIKNFSLQYDLFKEQERLKQYSEKLEDLVAERTKELAKSQAMLKALHEHANDGILIFDKEGNIIDANNKACELHGYTKEELKGMNITMLESETNIPLCKERIQRLLNGESLLFETQHVRKDGERIILEVSSCAIKFNDDIVIESFLRDITEKKRLQNQLLHAQKMESVGTLAGGIAHDFNNILTSILGYASLLVENQHLPQDVISKIKVIESSARKASNIVSKLLSFARKKGKEVVPLNLNSIIEDSLTMTAKLIPKDIEIKKELDPGLPIINGDITQLEQVIINLLINAKDAMPEGGIIHIKTSTETIDHNKLKIFADIKPGRYVKLEISDTGTGIPAEIKDRIFEPFFTTKESGKGTGLGLAMVYGIIKDHEGYIIVNSSPGKGTSFCIYLPAANKTPVIKHLELSDKKASPGKVMVVDDELPVLQFIKDVLVEHGFEVQVFQNPFISLEYFRKNNDNIDIVITDILMPQMDGGELIKRVKNIKKDIRTIAMTGFVDALSTIEADIYLEKPIKKETLLNVIDSLNLSH
jgi:PAS domain S-box-containing protein